jgi:hypothetical protein
VSETVRSGLGILGAVIGAVVLIVIVVAGMGMSGAWDKYFTVRLVNRTTHVVAVGNGGDTVRLRPGQTDAEWGSSTASQPIQLRLGRSRTCVNLFFRTAPSRPLQISAVGHHLRVARAPGC